MEFWINLGITAMLELLRARRVDAKWKPALAKVFVKIELVAEMDEGLRAEIEHQRTKEGLTK